MFAYPSLTPRAEESDSNSTSLGLDIKVGIVSNSTFS